MTFQFDTTGTVATYDRAFWDGQVRWTDLTPFTQGYIEALFDSICPEEDGSREMRTPRFDDLAPETLARIIADCESRAWPEKDGKWFWVSRQNGNLDAFPPLTVQLGDDRKVRFG